MSIKETATYSRQDISEDDIEAVVTALKANLITGGTFVQSFEDNIAKTVGSDYAVSCSSCTAALHLASMSAGISHGDYVVVPTITFAATANVPRLMGAEVIFADVDPNSGLMTAETLLDAIKRSPEIPKVVYLVHLSGQSCNIGAISEIAEKFGIKIIDDAAHALGAKHNGKLIGSFENILASCFSFHPVKPITTGEGGAVTTNDAIIAQKLFQLRSHGVQRSPDEFINRQMAFDKNKKLAQWYYEIADIGLNYRASDLNCALGDSQLKKLSKYTKIRQNLAQLYFKELQVLSEYLVPIDRGPLGEDAYHLFPVLIDFHENKFTKQELMDKLNDKQIASQVHYIPVHLQPYYARRYGEQDLPGSLSYYTRTLSLPLHTRMTRDDVSYVTQTLSEILSA